jgi:putative transcription factor
MNSIEECHICGRPAVAQGVVEGVTVWLCAKDMSFGRPVKEAAAPKPYAPTKPASQEFRPAAYTAPRPQAKPREHAIADDFPQAVVRAREKLGLTRQQLARQIFVMENVLERIEHGHLTPDIGTAQKLERALGIKLVVDEAASAEPEEKTASKSGSAGSGGSTLADVIDVKMKK